MRRTEAGRGWIVVAVVRQHLVGENENEFPFNL